MCEAFSRRTGSLLVLPPFIERVVKDDWELCLYFFLIAHTSLPTP